MKSNLQESNSRVDKAGNQISDLEYKEAKNTQLEQQKEKRIQKNEEVLEAQRVLNKMDTKRTTPRHIIIKMPKIKDKERILKTETESKLVTYRRVPIRLSADFSKETLQAKRDWQEIIQNDERQ